MIFGKYLEKYNFPSGASAAFIHKLDGPCDHSCQYFPFKLRVKTHQAIFVWCLIDQTKNDVLTKRWKTESWGTFPENSHKSAGLHERNVSQAQSGAIISSMSLSKRRRRKTVHFGDNFLLQVCANTNFYMPPYEQMETNVQKFFNFIESVLSTWVRDAHQKMGVPASTSLMVFRQVTEEAPPSQGDTSEMDERAIEKRRHKKKIRKQIIYRLAKEVTKLNKSTVMGNLRYRHIHWNEKQDAERCNALFLLKVSASSINQSSTVWMCFLCFHQSPI